MEGREDESDGRSENTSTGREEKDAKTRSSTLHINLLSAQGLKNVSMFAKMSTYAVAWTDPSRKLVSPIAHSAGCSPVWNFKMTFPLCSDLSEDGTCLTVEIYSYTPSSSTLVGNVTIPLHEITNYTEDNLQYISCQLQRPSGRIHGIVNLSVQTVQRASPKASSKRMSLTKCLSVQPHQTPLVGPIEEEVVHDDSSVLNRKSFGIKFQSGKARSDKRPDTDKRSDTDKESPRRGKPDKVSAPDILDFEHGQSSRPRHQHQAHYHQGPTQQPGASSSHGQSSQPSNDPSGLGLGGGLEGGTLGAYVLGSEGSAAMANLAHALGGSSDYK